MVHEYNPCNKSTYPHGRDVNYKTMFYVVCRNIMDYAPFPGAVDLVTTLDIGSQRKKLEN